MTYLEFTFSIRPLEPAREILIAELGELGFDSFVEVESGLLAYILAEHWADHPLDKLFIFQNPDVEISWTSIEMEQQNWNTAWEKNFEPIEISDDCRVRAPFHSKKKCSL